MESYTSYGSYSLDQSDLYDNTFTPYTQTGTPDTSNWWKCCHNGCGCAVDPSRHEDTCPDCHHKRCDSCTTTSPPLTPIKNQFGLGFEAPSHGHSLQQGAPAHYNDYPQYENTHHVQYSPVGNSSGPGYEFGRRPCLDGWWQCCQCSQEVNSAWYGTDCTSCSHHFDDCCTNLGSTSI